MREKEVEAALVKAAKKRNGVALKFVSPGLSGVPDRLVLLPDGKIGFILHFVLWHGRGNALFLLYAYDQS